MGLRPIPGKPGHFIDTASGKPTVLTEAREGARYDTVEQTSGAITAGTELLFFNTKSSKSKLDTNIPEAGRIVTASEMLVLERIGLGVEQAVATTLTTAQDVRRIICHGFVKVTLNNKVLSQGPGELYPPGFGIAGQTNENNTGIVTNGIASTAAQRAMVEQQIITANHSVEATLTFQSRGWLTSSTLPTLDNDNAIRLWLVGLLVAAATNN